MTRNALLLGLQTAVALMLFSCGQAASVPQQTPTPTAQPTLTAAEQAQLTALEARPLKIPPMPASGICPDGPHSTISPYQNTSNAAEVWGSGPVYAKGGPEINGSQTYYFDVTYYTLPSVKGMVLIRGQQLGGGPIVVFVGAYAAGPVLGTDTIGANGKPLDMHAELALPADHPPSSAIAARGWGIWPVRQGIAKSYDSRCTALQFDTATVSDVVVAAG